MKKNTCRFFSFVFVFVFLFQEFSIAGGIYKFSFADETSHTLAAVSAINNEKFEKVVGAFRSLLEAKAGLGDLDLMKLQSDIQDATSNRNLRVAKDDSNNFYLFSDAPNTDSKAVVWRFSGKDNRATLPEVFADAINLYGAAEGQDIGNYRVEIYERTNEMNEFLRGLRVSSLKGMSSAYVGQYRRTAAGAADLKHGLSEADYELVLGVLNEYEGVERELVRKEILSNPAIMAKIMLSCEHSFIFAIKKDDTEAKKEFVNGLVKKYITKDRATRFIEGNLDERVQKILLGSTDMFAKASVVYEYSRKNARTRAKELLIELAEGRVDDARLNSFIEKMGKPKYKGSGFSIFFNNKSNPKGLDGIEDTDTMTIYDYIHWAHQKGLSDLELSADFLYFDKSKRMPSEITGQERKQIKALAKLYGITLSVHSPLVGPLKFGAGDLFIDPTDNVGLYKETIQFCEDIGAKSVVVHIVETDNDAIDRMVQILLAAKGTGVKVSFENSYNKAKVFPSIDKICETLREVAKRTYEKDKEALKNLATTFDVAHYNLTRPQKGKEDEDNDPLVAAVVMAKLADDLKKEYGDYFDRDGFIAEVHANQNIGPIGFYTAFSADLHSPVEHRGPIDIEATIRYFYSMGFSPVVIAEQKETVSDAGLALIERAVKEGKAARYVLRNNKKKIAKKIAYGKRLCRKLFYHDNYKEYFKTKEQRNAYYLFAADKGQGLLKKHLDQRRMQAMLTRAANFGENIKTFNAEKELMHYGDEGNFMYFILGGEVGIYDEHGTRRMEDGKPMTRRVGEFVGEMALINKDKRNSTVKAETEVTVFKMDSETFNRLRGISRDFADLTNEHALKRYNTIQINKLKRYLKDFVEGNIPAGDRIVSVAKLGFVVSVKQLSEKFRIDDSIVRKAVAELGAELPDNVTILKASRVGITVARSASIPQKATGSVEASV